MYPRFWVLAACLVALVCLVILAPGLRTASFEPPRPFVFSAESSRPFSLAALSIPEDTPLWKILAFWLALVLNLGLILVLLSPELRRRLLRQVVRFAAGVLLFLLILRYRVVEWPAADMEPAIGAQVGPSPVVPAVEVPTFVPPEAASWLSLAVGLLLAWLVLLGVFIGHRAWLRHRTRPQKALDELGEIARTSLADLASGRQWGDVVVEAYARMNEAVQRGTGLHRESSSTPREFALHLARRGLPASAVEELTRLFESVRYGGRSSDAVAGRRAAACLESIVRACEPTI